MRIETAFVRPWLALVIACGTPSDDPPPEVGDDSGSTGVTPATSTGPSPTASTGAASTDASTGADGSSTGTGSSTGPDTGAQEFDCEPGSKLGPAEGVEGATTAGGRGVNVRIPGAYSATTAHPLIVVYSFATGTAESSEEFFNLTEPALAAGYIVAYADHGTPSSVDDVADLAGVPALIAREWCVDEERIFLTGHSDGATVSTFISVSPGTEPQPAGILPSAAGVDAISFQTVACPEDPFPVMVMHGTEDSVFPGRGAEAAAWWAECNGCEDTLDAPDADGCAAYAGCPDDQRVTFCEGPWTHFAWPDLDPAMLAFMAAVP